MSHDICILAITKDGRIVRLKNWKLGKRTYRLPDIAHISPFYRVEDVIEKHKYAKTIYWDASTFVGKTYKKVMSLLREALEEMKKILKIRSDKEVEALHQDTEERLNNPYFQEGMNATPVGIKYMKKINTLEDEMKNKVCPDTKLAQDIIILRHEMRRALIEESYERAIKAAKSEEKKETTSKYLDGEEMIASFAQYTLKIIHHLKDIETFGLENYIFFTQEDTQDNEDFVFAGKIYIYDYECSNIDETLTFDDLITVV